MFMSLSHWSDPKTRKYINTVQSKIYKVRFLRLGKEFCCCYSGDTLSLQHFTRDCECMRLSQWLYEVPRVRGTGSCVCLSASFLIIECYCCMSDTKPEPSWKATAILTFPIFKSLRVSWSSTPGQKSCLWEIPMLFFFPCSCIKSFCRWAV